MIPSYGIRSLQVRSGLFSNSLTVPTLALLGLLVTYALDYRSAVLALTKSFQQPLRSDRPCLREYSRPYITYRHVLISSVEPGDSLAKQPDICRLPTELVQE